MTDLSPRSRESVSRRERERRAYTLVKAGGAGSVLLVAGVILAALGVGFGTTLAVVGLLIAVVCALLFRRVVGR